MVVKPKKYVGKAMLQTTFEVETLKQTLTRPEALVFLEHCCSVTRHFVDDREKLFQPLLHPVVRLNADLEW